jgi:predicted metal-binding membrane protein
MRTTISSVTDDSKFSSLVGRIRPLFMKHPEWLAWFFSLFVWALLGMGLFNASQEMRHSAGHIIYCVPPGTIEVTGASAHEIQPIYSQVLNTIPNGILPWVIMVVAMMFPLLNEPIRQVAFSVKRRDRYLGILGFLIGYTLTWTLAGLLFLLLPFFPDMLPGNQTHFVSALIKSSGFLLAATLTWLPSRAIKMTKCSQTMPIRIEGWQLQTDCVIFGLKMGFACLHMCWAPMAALMLVKHNIFLMYVITMVIIYERYLLPHTSKLPGYAWGAIALILFGIEMWA